MNEEKYKGFEYNAKDLQKYLYTAGLFTISLTNGQIIHHSPDDVQSFNDWLQKHKVANIRENKT